MVFYSVNLDCGDIFPPSELRFARSADAVRLVTIYRRNDLEASSTYVLRIFSDISVMSSRTNRPADRTSTRTDPGTDRGAAGRARVRSDMRAQRSDTLGARTDMLRAVADPNPRRRRRRTINISASKGASGDCISASVEKLGKGWRISDKTTTTADDVYLVIQRESLHKRINTMSEHSLVSKFPGMHSLCEKVNFTRSMNFLASLSGEGATHTLPFWPRTWIIPDEMHDLEIQMAARIEVWASLPKKQKEKQPPPCWIVKPEAGKLKQMVDRLCQKRHCVVDNVRTKSLVAKCLSRMLLHESTPSLRCVRKLV